MRQVILSTIGTSLLTNQINRANPEEKDWYSHLRDTANLSDKKHQRMLRKLLLLSNKERMYNSLVQKSL